MTIRWVRDLRAPRKKPHAADYLGAPFFFCGRITPHWPFDWHHLRRAPRISDRCVRCENKRRAA
jgi:hypothetical protein